MGGGSGVAAMKVHLDENGGGNHGWPGAYSARRSPRTSRAVTVASTRPASSATPTLRPITRLPA